MKTTPLPPIVRSLSLPLLMACLFGAQDLMSSFAAVAPASTAQSAPTTTAVAPSASLDDLSKLILLNADDPPEIRAGKRVLRAMLEVLGPENEIVASNLNDLGMRYHQLGRFNEAKPLY